MEIEGEDGTKLFLKPGIKSVFGRGAGFNTEDLTVSRRHVSLELKPYAATGTERSDRVSFEVLGRNPIWVRVGEKIRTFRKSERGEISAGDRFCVSGHLPIWFNLKSRDEVMEERVSDGESGLDSIDPVKQFGFLVIGKEFDKYSKSRLCDVKQWEWFLEDFMNVNSDDDDGGDKKGRKGLGKKRRRRRKKGNEDDDDWSVESEEDKEMIVKSKGVLSPTYSTRSKKTKKDTNASSSSAQTKQHGRVAVEEDDDGDEDDVTLGGFIVSDEEAKLEEEEEANTDDDEEVDSDEDEDED